MTSADHPSFPNPTIQEAVCEITFRPQGGAWNPLIFGQFFEMVKADFPYIETVPLPLFQFHPLGLSGPTQVATAPPQVIRYRHVSRPVLLQLTENRLGVICIGNYPGWSQMSSDIESAWANLTTVARPEAIVRTGIRYINRIERRTASETLGDWLVSTDYIPQAVLTSLPGFILQMQTKTHETSRTSVTIGESGGESAALTAFIFDIDRISDRQISADLSDLIAEAERLHDDVWNVFAAATGPKLRKLLEGELL
jgi:uncharacterized protein (TIGR04255 family)